MLAPAFALPPSAAAVAARPPLLRGECAQNPTGVPAVPLLLLRRARPRLRGLLSGVTSSEARFPAALDEPEIGHTGNEHLAEGAQPVNLILPMRRCSRRSMTQTYLSTRVAGYVRRRDAAPVCRDRGLRAIGRHGASGTRDGPASITFVGLDLNQRTTSVAIAEAGRGDKARFLSQSPSTQRRCTA
jgi:hypothetical protein